jgi:hypothetical protein
MEKENLALYVHGMGRRRLSTPKEKLTDKEKQDLIEDFYINENNSFEVKEIIKKGQVIDYTI